MFRHFCLLAFCVLTVAASAVAATSYAPDKIVPLPVPPNPDYTNYDSGTVVPPPFPGEYIVEVENTLRMENWKEWLIIYTFTATGPNPVIDVHIDYSTQVGEDPPMFADLALWQTYYGPIPATGTWTVVGFPFSIGQPMKVNPQLADFVVDTWQIPYNPAWVSLRFAGQDVSISYQFYDWCIPEPATLALLGVGGLCALRRRR